MKYLLIILFVISGTNFCNAQKFSFKKDKLLLDGKEILKYEYEYLGTNYANYFYDLETDEKVIIIKKDDNNTRNYSDDDFIKIRFPKLDRELEMKGVMALKWYIQLLHKNKVLNDDGSINEEKVLEFIKNYNDNVSNK